MHWNVYPQDEGLDGYNFTEFNDDSFSFDTAEEAISWAMKRFYSEGHFGPWYLDGNYDEETNHTSEYRLYELIENHEDEFLVNRKKIWIEFKEVEYNENV